MLEQTGPRGLVSGDLDVLFADYYLALHPVEAFECFLGNFLDKVIFFDYFLKKSWRAALGTSCNTGGSVCVYGICNEQTSKNPQSVCSDPLMQSSGRILYSQNSSGIINIATRNVLCWVCSSQLSPPHNPRWQMPINLLVGAVMFWRFFVCKIQEFVEMC